MWTLVKRGLGIVVLGYLGYAAWDYHRAGYFTRPDMPEGAFSISYKSGLRAILIGIKNEQESRRYLGYPMDVPFYLKETWAKCSPPTEQEKPNVEGFMAEHNMPGQRFEAVCRIQADSDVVVRGLITSVPRL
ncbi:hypothetical protein EYC79_07500 [Agrobacterium cavarae]|uniref:Uncharacterized protein n=1 Tax=Agrobacterium cavarae TaxID=2528239 RepID=A0ABY1YD48_9HYPH|nr:hypothetical protein [Agrobacterium cavarae]TBN14860.1 hypothetical protein EYC79_07500 [Agrobacterium cavarae]